MTQLVHFVCLNSVQFLFKLNICDFRFFHELFNFFYLFFPFLLAYHFRKSLFTDKLKEKFLEMLIR